MGRFLTQLLPPADPDESLVRAAQNGEAAAFDRLVRRHEAALLGFLAARLLSEEAAREVAQECLLAAWKQLPRFNRRSRFKTWLFGIATHKATDYLRRCASLPRTLALHDAEKLLESSDGAWGADPQRLVDRAESELRIRDAVARLPAVQRQALELYYYGDLTLREIATLLNINLSTLKYQFYQAHRALRPLVADLMDLLPPGGGDARRGSGPRVISYEL